MKKVRFLFDLDGTITSEELLPLIAKKLNLYEEINILTELTLKGDIPFASSFKLRVEILKQVDVSFVHSIINNVKVNPLIVDFIKKNASMCCIATNNLDIWVSSFCKNFGCDFFTSTASVKEGKVLGIEKILRKSDCLNHYQDYYTIAIGDGMNDAELLRSANFGIAYGGVHPPCQALLESSNATVHNEKELCKLLNQLLSHVQG